MTLAEKLHAIQKLARKVPKRGVHEHGWSYMQVEDVVSIATRFMAKYKLLLTPDTQHLNRVANERGGSVADVAVVWKLEDLESQESRTFGVPGSGFDYDSKGTAKALTDSRKSAMILIFNLKGGDDPERAPATRGEAKDRQQEIADNKLANAAAGRGIDANVPALFYTWNDETQTGVVTGDKPLLASAAKLFAEYKFPKSATQWYVNAEQMERIKIVLEERGIPLKKLLAGTAWRCPPQRSHANERRARRS